MDTLIILLRLVRDGDTPVVPVDEGEESDESDKEVAVEPVIPHPKVAEVIELNKISKQHLDLLYSKTPDRAESSISSLPDIPSLTSVGPPPILQVQLNDLLFK